LEWTDEKTLNGSNSLRFTKGTSATSLNSALRFLIPATPGCVSLGFVNFLFPIDYAPADPDETHELYFRLFWVRSIGPDEYGRPIIVRELFAGYTTMNVPRAGSDDWQRILLSTTYSETSGDPLAEARTHSPEWSSHLAIYLDTQALPDEQVFYMADMHVNFLR
ncbi:MAG TPA: hypothetical protein VLZ84_12860, partial [Asticcacaulis sp.]|nr:hypothetical protein [Asticcacaulis sp.]